MKTDTKKVSRFRREWCNMGIKDTILYSLAVISFFAGFALLFLSFFTPPKGIIDNSVIFVSGEALVFTATVLGIGQHYKHELNKFKARVNSELTSLEAFSNASYESKVASLERLNNIPSFGDDEADVIPVTGNEAMIPNEN